MYWFNTLVLKSIWNFHWSKSIVWLPCFCSKSTNFWPKRHPAEFCIFHDFCHIFKHCVIKAGGRDPALLNTLMRMLPPSSKVKDYLKYSTPKCHTLIRPVSAGGALKGLHKKATEKIHLDVLHPDFRIRRRSLSIERNSLSLNVPIFTSHSQHELGYLQRSMASSMGSSAILSPAGKSQWLKITKNAHLLHF